MKPSHAIAHNADTIHIDIIAGLQIIQSAAIVVQGLGDCIAKAGIVFSKGRVRVVVEIDPLIVIFGNAVSVTLCIEGQYGVTRPSVEPCVRCLR